MTPITRKRALEVAISSIRDEMNRVYPRIPKVGKLAEDHYAELAAALAYIENLARQKELL